MEIDAYDGPQDPRYDNVFITNPTLGHDGTIYLTAVSRDITNPPPKNGTLYAITDLGAGAEVKWRYRPDFDGEGPGFSLAFSSPTVGDDGRIYYGSWDIVKNEQGAMIHRPAPCGACETYPGSPWPIGVWIPWAALRSARWRVRL